MVIMCIKPRFSHMQATVLLREASLFMGWGGGIREKVSYDVANCALGYFGVLLLDP